MTTSPLLPGFPIPLTSGIWGLAQSHATPQPDLEKYQQQVRLEVAIYAVEFYLRCMAFELETRNRQHPLLTQLLGEEGDVVIKELGKLTCVPIWPGDQTIQLSSDTGDDSLAYLIIQIDALSQQAHLLGFIPQTIPVHGEISVERLQAIDGLPQYLSDCKITVLSQILDWAQKQEENLVEFLNTVSGNFQGWQLNPSLNLAFMGEVEGNRKGIESIFSTPILIEKSLNLQDLDLELVMNLSPKADHRLLIELLVESELEQVLPEDLELNIIDAAGEVFQTLSPAANSCDLYAQPFSAAPGEGFTIALNYGEAEYTEELIV